MAINDVKKEIEFDNRIRGLENFYRVQQNLIEKKVERISNKTDKMEDLIGKLVVVTSNILEKVSGINQNTIIQSIKSNENGNSRNSGIIDPENAFIPSINIDSFTKNENSSIIIGDSDESIANFINTLNNKEDEMHKVEELEVNDGRLCDYGCGKLARYVLDNGKLCCEAHYTKCPSVKEKMSKSKSNKVVDCKK